MNEHQIHEKNRCGKTQSIYKSGQYLEKHPTWHSEDSFWKAQQIIKVLSDKFLVENFADKKVSIVDIGCGAGGVLGNLREILLSKGHEIDRCIGIDTASDALRKAREKWPNIQFLNRDLAELREHFDIGLLIDVIEHLENPNHSVEASAAFCDYLIFHIPLDDNYDTKIRNRYRYYVETLGHIQYFNRKTALKFLETNNLEIIDSIFTKRFLCAKRATLAAKLVFPLRLFLSFLSTSVCARTFGGLSLMVLTKRLQMA